MSEKVEDKIKELEDRLANIKVNKATKKNSKLNLIPKILKHN